MACQRNNPAGSLGRCLGLGHSRLLVRWRGTQKEPERGVRQQSVGPVPQHRGEPSSSNQGKRGRRRDEWVEEEEPRNSAKLNLAAYLAIAWPPSKAQEKDPREEQNLAAAVAGLACQEGEEEVNVDSDTLKDPREEQDLAAAVEGEEEVNVDSDTLKADVVVISDPDWGTSDPEIQEAFVPMTMLEGSLEVKTEARSEPGETLQEAGPATPATKLPVAKAEAR